MKNFKYNHNIGVVLDDAGSGDCSEETRLVDDIKKAVKYQRLLAVRFKDGCVDILVCDVPAWDFVPDGPRFEKGVRTRVYEKNPDGKSFVLSFWQGGNLSHVGDEREALEDFFSKKYELAADHVFFVLKDAGIPLKRYCFHEEFTWKVLEEEEFEKPRWFKEESAVVPNSFSQDICEQETVEMWTLEGHNEHVYVRIVPDEFDDELRYRKVFFDFRYLFDANGADIVLVESSLTEKAFKEALENAWMETAEKDNRKVAFRGAVRDKMAPLLAVKNDD